MTEEFRISGMICSRCLKVLSTKLKATGAEVIEIQLGKIVIRYDPDSTNRSLSEHIIRDNEFEIIQEKRKSLKGINKYKQYEND